jgi:hypothetical protein
LFDEIELKGNYNTENKTKWRLLVETKIRNVYAILFITFKIVRNSVVY